MSKITKTVNGNITTYFYDGVRKYVHYKGSDGYESWREYDERGNEVHYKDSDGDEWWSDDHPNNPKNVPLNEDYVLPFEFGNH